MTDLNDAGIPPEDKSTEADSKIHDRAMRRFDESVLPQMPVRELALMARRFADIPGAMWEGSVGDAYGKDAIKLEFPKLKRALRKLENDFRQNRIEPDFRPSGGASDRETADTLDSLYRADAKFFKAQQARDNARSEAAKGGFGAYRLCNDWADPLDKDSDYQRVNPASLIADADQSVFFGPSTLYDKSDAKFAFVLTGWSEEAFKEEYPDAQYTGWPDANKRSWVYDWFRPDTIAVCEYYEVEDRDENVLIFTQETSGEEERYWQKDLSAQDIKDLRDRGFTQRKRKAKRRRCHKYIMSGAEVLEDCGYIAGGNIPIVPVYGERAYVDGVEWFRGIVQQNMDMVRVFNAVMSSLYEITTLAPYERPIFTAEQMPPNLAEMWARGNIDRHPYALVNPLLNPVDGSIAAAGPVGKVETPQVPATLAAMVEMLNGLFAEDDQNPEEVKANTSADAMDIAAARVDAKSGIFLDNDRQSTQRAGELYLAMACEVYVEPGRVVETMTEDGDDGEATLHEDYSDAGELKVRNNFQQGRYKVVADVAETTTTRRDRTVKQMLTYAEVSVAAQDMEGAQAALITAGLNMDGEGINDFQDWQRARALKLGLVKPNEDEQRQAEEEAQAQGPDVQQQLLEKQMEKLAAETQKALTAAGLDQAKIQQVMADANLKVAQAEAVGGPEAVPQAPSGLDAANDDAKRVSEYARADLHSAQAEKIRSEIPMQRIKTGRELDLAERAQDHAERQTA
jgi:hypothetical protein